MYILTACGLMPPAPGSRRNSESIARTRKASREIRASWVALGGSWAALGRSWELSLGLLGRSWAVLGLLGGSCEVLGRS